MTTRPGRYLRIYLKRYSEREKQVNSAILWQEARYPTTIPLLALPPLLDIVSHNLGKTVLDAETGFFHENPRREREGYR